jgi:hypothetical protein
MAQFVAQIDAKRRTGMCAVVVVVMVVMVRRRRGNEKSGTERCRLYRIN